MNRQQKRAQERQMKKSIKVMVNSGKISTNVSTSPIAKAAYMDYEYLCKNGLAPILIEGQDDYGIASEVTMVVDNFVRKYKQVNPQHVKVTLSEYNNSGMETLLDSYLIPVSKLK